MYVQAIVGRDKTVPEGEEEADPRLDFPGRPGDILAGNSWPGRPWTRLPSCISQAGRKNHKKGKDDSEPLVPGFFRSSPVIQILPGFAPSFSPIVPAQRQTEGIRILIRRTNSKSPVASTRDFLKLQSLVPQNESA